MACLQRKERQYPVRTENNESELGSERTIIETSADGIDPFSAILTM